MLVTWTAGIDLPSSFGAKVVLRTNGSDFQPGCVGTGVSDATNYALIFTSIKPGWRAAKF
jgi:hypothetical protein